MYYNIILHRKITSDISNYGEYIREGAIYVFLTVFQMFSILSTQLQKQNITVGHKVITVAMNTLNHAPDFIVSHPMILPHIATII